MTTLFPLTSDFDRFFEDFSKEIYKSDTNSFPRYNLYTDGEETAFISIAVTGIPEEKLEAFIDDEGYLVIKADIEKDKRDYIVKQYPIKSFEKKFWIDKRYEVGTIVVENGELTVRLNRKEPKRKEIPIIGKTIDTKAEEAA
jgi:HSP20 family molecular chaperone IbpA